MVPQFPLKILFSQQVASFPFCNLDIIGDYFLSLFSGDRLLVANKDQVKNHKKNDTPSMVYKQT
jgi:hypothetical protein